MAKVIGKLWSSLSDKDKAVYQQQAAEERECVSKLVEKYKDAMPKTTTTTSTTTKITNEVYQMNDRILLVGVVESCVSVFYFSWVILAARFSK